MQLLVVAAMAILPSVMAWTPRLHVQRMASFETLQIASRTVIFRTASTGRWTLSASGDDDNTSQQGNVDDGEDSDVSPLQEALNQEEPALHQQQQQQQQRAPGPPASPPPRRLDPLIASLTRMDDTMRNAPTVKAPIFGEIPLDGSLVVLVPTTLIVIVGFVMSIYIAFNSQDVIVASLNDLNKDIVTSVSGGPPQILAPDENGCRGLCSTQEQDLEGLRVFMNNLAGRK